MKKIFLALAFTGIVGAASAATLSFGFLNKTLESSIAGEKDKKKSKKSCCKSDSKACKKHEDKAEPSPKSCMSGSKSEARRNSGNSKKRAE